jgi:hypothetical protein
MDADEDEGYHTPQDGNGYEESACNKPKHLHHPHSDGLNLTFSRNRAGGASHDESRDFPTEM